MTIIEDQLVFAQDETWVSQNSQPAAGALDIGPPWVALQPSPGPLLGDQVPSKRYHAYVRVAGVVQTGAPPGAPDLAVGSRVDFVLNNGQNQDSYGLNIAIVSIPFGAPIGKGGPRVKWGVSAATNAAFVGPSGFLQGGIITNWSLATDPFPCWLHLAIDAESGDITVAITDDQAGNSPKIAAVCDTDEAPHDHGSLAIKRTVNSPLLSSPAHNVWTGLRQSMEGHYNPITGHPLPPPYDAWTFSNWRLYAAIDTKPKVGIGNSSIAAGQHQTGLLPT